MINWQKPNPFSLAGSYKYKVTDSVISVQSSLKSHPLWVVYPVPFFVFKLISAWGTLLSLN